MESTLGTWVKGRCKATNLCDYCARLAAVETAEVLALDAMTNSAPSVWAVLTTRTATLDTARFYKSREAVIRALRRRWPHLEYVCLVEFTTGYGRNSNGERRPHWNLLLKGVTRDELVDVAAIIRDVWCSREDATADAQHVGLVSEHGGLMRYLALHFLKETQQPPKGWRGHRFLKSRGYLGQPTEAARAAARDALRFKRALHRAHKAGLTGEEAEEAAHREHYEMSELAWQLVRLANVPTAFDGDDQPTEFEVVGCPIA